MNQRRSFPINQFFSSWPPFPAIVCAVFYTMTVRPFHFRIENKADAVHYDFNPPVGTDFSISIFHISQTDTRLQAAFLCQIVKSCRPVTTVTCFFVQKTRSTRFFPTIICNRNEGSFPVNTVLQHILITNSQLVFFCLLAHCSTLVKNLVYIAQKPVAGYSCHLCHIYITNPAVLGRKSICISESCRLIQ